MEPILSPPNPFVADDGQLVLPSFGGLFYLPGDWFIYLLTSRAPALAEVFGLSASDYGGTASGAVAWIFWIALALALIALTSAVRRLDRALTFGILDAVADIKRRVRMAFVFARYRRERRRAPRQEPTFEGEEPTVSRNEVRALDLYAKLAPGFALSVRDVAEELDMRVHESRSLLERLQGLKLLNSTVGGLDGETAYTLTAGGRALLQMRHARPKHA